MQTHTEKRDEELGLHDINHVVNILRRVWVSAIAEIGENPQGTKCLWQDMLHLAGAFRFANVYLFL